MAFNINDSESIRKLLTVSLGFIVVVALTIIAYNDIQVGVFKVKYKQAYAKANYAWQNTVMVNDINFSLSSNEHIKNFLLFEKQFNTTLECDEKNIQECWSLGESFFKDYPNEDSISFIDDKGRSWTSACSFRCSGEILVDVNNIEPPNKYGKDRFVFCPSTSGVGYYLNRPMTLLPPEDYKYVNEYFCPSGKCFYQSWLY